MLAFILQRLAQALLVMLVVGLISFSLFQFVGDPINNMLGPRRPSSSVRPCASGSGSTTRSRCSS